MPEESNTSDANSSETLRRAFTDLCNACRAGDIDLVESLVATQDLDINQVDDWDYSPLILLSLCGHLEIVRILLASGAVCDRDTFQGARCVYGALNDTIRDLLLSYEVSKAVDVLQPFASHISSILFGFGAHTKDICFYFGHANGVLARGYQHFRVNRFLLAARSSYFREKLTNGGSWTNRTVVEMPITADPAIFKIIVDYLYLRTDGLPLEDVELLEELLKFAKKLKLHDLVECVEKIRDASVSLGSKRGSVPVPVEPAGDSLEVEIATAIDTNPLVTISEEMYTAEDLPDPDVTTSSLRTPWTIIPQTLSTTKIISKIKNEYSYKFVAQARADLHSFLEQCIFSNKQETEVEDDIDFEDIDISLHINKAQRVDLFNSSGLPDTIVAIIDSDIGAVVYYPVNKSILTRSEFFDTMFKSDLFTLSQLNYPTINTYKTGSIAVIDRELFHVDHVPVLQLSAMVSKSSVAEMVLSYLYHDDLPNIPLDTTIELLFASDELCLDRLRTKCAVNISLNFSRFTWEETQQLSQKTGYSAFDLIRAAWQTHCDKLEQHVTKMISYNLSHIFNDKQWKQDLLGLITESAGRIKERQDTDTIELVDDIRYYLSKKYSVRDEFADFEPIRFKFDDVQTEDIKVVQTAMRKHDLDIEMIDSLLQELFLDA